MITIYLCIYFFNIEEFITLRYFFTKLLSLFPKTKTVFALKTGSTLWDLRNTSINLPVHDQSMDIWLVKIINLFVNQIPRQADSSVVDCAEISQCFYLSYTTWLSFEFKRTVENIQKQTLNPHMSQKHVQAFTLKPEREK